MSFFIVHLLYSCTGGIWQFCAVLSFQVHLCEDREHSGGSEQEEEEDNCFPLLVFVKSILNFQSIFNSLFLLIRIMVGVNRRRRVTIDRQDWICQINFKFSIFNYFFSFFQSIYTVVEVKSRRTIVFH